MYRGIHATLLGFRTPFKFKKASQVDPLSSRLLSDRRINNPGSVAHSRWLQPCASWFELSCVPSFTTTTMLMCMRARVTLVLTGLLLRSPFVLAEDVRQPYELTVIRDAGTLKCMRVALLAVRSTITEVTEGLGSHFSDLVADDGSAPG